VAMGVCQIWRAITQSTPLLWDDVRVRFGDQHEAPFDIICRSLGFGGQSPLNLELIFGRSSSIPRISRRQLRLYRNNNAPGPSTGWGWNAPIYEDDGWGDWRETGAWGNVPIPPPAPTNYEFTCDYVETIVPHLPRCESLVWNVAASQTDTWTWDAAWLSRRMNNLAMNKLKRLRVELRSLDQQREGNHNQAVRKLCHGSPFLTDITMRHGIWHPLSTTSLRNLHLVHCSVNLDDFLSALAQQQSLTSLKIFRSWFSVGDTRGGSPIQDVSTSAEASRPHFTIKMPALKEVFYEWKEGREIEVSPFPRLACPNLHRAVVRFFDWEAVLPELVAFFLRSPSLAEVALPLLPSQPLEAIFQALPSVRDFLGFPLTHRWAAGAGSNISFFDAAAAPGTLPVLCRLSLLCTATPDDTMTWIKSRHLCGHALKLFLSGVDFHQYEPSVQSSDSDNSPNQEDLSPPWTEASWKAALQSQSVELVAQSWPDTDLYWPDGKTGHSR